MTVAMLTCREWCTLRVKGLGAGGITSWFKLTGWKSTSTLENRTGTLWPSLVFFCPVTPHPHRPRAHSRILLRHCPMQSWGRAASQLCQQRRHWLTHFAPLLCVQCQPINGGSEVPVTADTHSMCPDSFVVSGVGGAALACSPIMPVHPKEQAVSQPRLVLNTVCDCRGCIRGQGRGEACKRIGDTGTGVQHSVRCQVQLGGPDQA